MRLSLYAPLLGLSAMAALAQTPPGGQNDPNQKVMNGWMRGSLKVAPEPRFAPRLTCDLCTMAAPQREAQGGANRAAVERAIRALGARIFPGKRLAAGRAVREQPGFYIPGKRRDAPTP